MSSVLRDKLDNTRGLNKKDTSSREITTLEHIIQIDSRDCVGIESLNKARIAFEANGGRKEASNVILGTTGLGVSPIVVTIPYTTQLKNGDIVTLEGVQGNTIANNTWKIFGLGSGSFELGAQGNGNYAGGGTWIRQADNGYPTITSETNTIIGNEMIIILQKRLKAIRSITLNASVIPRDIIPIYCYYKDLYNNFYSISLEPSYIPQEEKLMKLQSYGFYTTNISIFRSYAGEFAMPNQVTPPPLNLWNPPSPQPTPYNYQTVPTYVATIPIGTINYNLVCSGYGVYDLNDWTQGTQAETEVARKALLLAIVRPQMFAELTWKEIIANCTTTSSSTTPFGYGQFQRFLCGPGLQLNYQPGLGDGANPTVAQSDWPVPFPNFAGNVWGPYDSPSARFQKFGLRDTLQDLFLNGDLDNLLGIPIIDLVNYPNTYGINTANLQTVDFSNIASTTNPNILNAMRLTSNGFGAVSVTATGNGGFDTNIYQNSGGIGPSILGAPSAWSLEGVYGAPSLGDPNAVGPLSWNLLTNGTIPQTAVGDLPNNYPSQTLEINHRISWYDLGPQAGAFKAQIRAYVLYAISNVPPQNLVIQSFQFPRDERVQSTNSEVGSSMLNIPIRLLPDISTDGGFQYVESLYALLTQVSDLAYWGKRFLTPMASLDKISLKFFTYDGIPIPLERQLSYPYPYYCTNNMSPLIRTRREISLIFRAECYQYINSGLDIIEMIDKILGIREEDESGGNFVVKASNYEDYS